jgi:hypothetical protein
MKKRFYRNVFVVAIILLIMIGTACMPPSAATPSGATTIAAVQADVAKLQQDLARKADVGQFTAHDTRIVAIEGKINSIQAPASTGYAKSETYSKAEVDKAVSDAVTKLQNDQAWIKAQTTPTPQSPYGVPTNPVTPTASGTVTMITNPVQLPQIYSGVGSITGTANPYTVQPTGYVQPYTMRITNGSTAIQYVKPIITISMSNQGGYYYGGSYPQLIFFNVSISSGYGIVQASAASAFAAPVAPATACASGAMAVGGLCPSTLNGGWYQITPPAPAVFPINLSPTTANTQATPSFSFTPTAGLNNYGEFMMTPGQTIDVMITIQLATLQQSTLQISNSISARQ